MEPSTLAQSFRAAWAGVVHVFRTQRNARLECAIAVAAVGAGAWLKISAIEWSVIATAVAAVLAAEIANSALEEVVNLLAPEYHAAARIAKDASAGAVLLLAIASVIVGLIILGPPLVARLGG